MSAEDRIRSYYNALRRGDPLAPFFAPDDTLVKFGISERLTGYEEVAAGLRDQTRTTEDWTVDSHRLRTTERGEAAWFSDDVTLAWTDRESGRRYAFDSRWSGTLVRRDGDWRFVGMHVSAPHEL